MLSDQKLSSQQHFQHQKKLFYIMINGEKLKIGSNQRAGYEIHIFDILLNKS